MIILFATLYFLVALWALRAFRRGYESWASSLLFAVFWLPLLWLLGCAAIYDWLTE